MKKRIFIRVFPFNILSYPVLLNAWEKNGVDKEFDIKIIDKPDLIEKTAFNKDDVILYSFMTPFLPLVHSEIEKIKKSGVLIVGGGPHINGEQELARAVGFDILFVGPAEESFLRFGSDLLDNKVREGIYRSSSQDDNLNSYLPISKYFKTIPPLEIMRGCRWKCKYCNTHLNRAAFRNLDSIRAYFEEMQRRKLQRVNFISPSAMEFGAVKARQTDIGQIEAVLKLARSPHSRGGAISGSAAGSAFDFKLVEYGIFPSEIRPDTVCDAGMKILKKYVSNKAVTIGAQSSSDARLKELRRGHSAADTEKAVEIANANGFLANLDFIIGYPGETARERTALIEFIKRLTGKYRVKTHLHHFFPLPGSGFAYRLPSFLSAREKENFLELKKDGISKVGWIGNERQVIDYFDWLKNRFPTFYERYH
ncbi:MAG: TIGR04013 family B12-binding domain/radical SAM domain-containing protein [Candidatus Aminicenantes bacterium]|nr:TIGR04013 family B12-binding domain/radical SAM domain-containing protein [Candidatus Aminicenantes bacterium]